MITIAYSAYKYKQAWLIGSSGHLMNTFSTLYLFIYSTLITQILIYKL